MDVQVVPFDPRNATREEWQRYHAYRRLRERETDPDDPISEDATVEGWMSRPHPQWQDIHNAVLQGERQIGHVYYELVRPGSPSYETNRHIGWAFVHLLRPHRRGQLGRRLLPTVVELARGHGQTVLQGWCEEQDGKAFAAAVGAKVVQLRRENRLYVDKVDWAMVEDWVRDGQARNPKTAIRWFVNRIDDDVIEEFSRVFTSVFNQQPFGKAEHGEVIFDPEMIRDREARNAAIGATQITVVTVEPNGDISGLTETNWQPDRPTFLGQGLTGVRDADRGRGLGKWIKAAMALRIRKEFPQVRVVVTGNASSNAAMLSINERLGFRMHKEPVVVQMDLADLERYMGRTG